MLRADLQWGRRGVPAELSSAVSVGLTTANRIGWGVVLLVKIDL